MLRPDRDSHLDLLWDNVKEGMKNQFEIPSEETYLRPTEDIPYDYLSIMHYGRYTFVKMDENVSRDHMRRYIFMVVRRLPINE